MGDQGKVRSAQSGKTASGAGEGLGKTPWDRGRRDMDCCKGELSLLPGRGQHPCERPAGIGQIQERWFPGQGQAG